MTVQNLLRGIYNCVLRGYSIALEATHVTVVVTLLATS